MRHRKGYRKLGRNTSHRRALLRHLVTALFESKSGRIKTTVEKAKEARRIAERMITFAKRDDLHSRRLVLRFVSDRAVVGRLFSDIAPRYSSRPGGYTRVLKLGPRKGDNAETAFLELVDMPDATQDAS